MPLRRAVEKVVPEGWSNQIIDESGVYWQQPDGTLTAMPPPDTFIVSEWDDANPTTVRSAPSDANGNITGAWSGWSNPVARGGDGGFFSETFGPTIDGTREFVTSPEFALVAGAGMAGNYFQTGSAFNNAGSGLERYIAQEAGAPGTMNTTVTPVGDYSGYPGWEDIGNEVYGGASGGGAGLPSLTTAGATLGAASAAKNLFGGDAATQQAIANGEMVPGQSSAMGTPQGYTLPDGTSIYGSPAQIYQAAQNGLIPGINTLSALKNLLGNDFNNIPGLSSGTSSLGRLLGLGQTGMDALNVGGALGSTALGMYAANQKAESLKRLADDSMTRWRDTMAIGAPSRGRYEASFQPGFSMANEPGYQDALGATTKATLHGLSVTGNPAGSPNAWAQTLEDVNNKFALPALNSYRNTNATTGGYAGFNLSAARGPDTDATMAALNADDQFYNAIGSGVADLTTPRNSLEELMKRFGGGNNIFKVA